MVQGFGRNSECGSQIQVPVLGSEAGHECLGKRDWREGERARGRGEELGWVGEREKREKIFFWLKCKTGPLTFTFCYFSSLSFSFVILVL